jgi:alpha/beta superfamily hydrolase
VIGIGDEMKTKYISILVIIVAIIGLAGSLLFYQFKDTKIEVDDGTLFGTLKHENYESIVMFISGSGPTDRDSNSTILSGRNDSIKEVALSLNKKGLSTFAYDKRFSGKSEAYFDNKNPLFDDLINDANAVLETLIELGYKDIYLVGHSQGALVAEVIGDRKEVKGVVSLCGTISPIDEVLKEQFKQLDVDNYKMVIEVIDKVKSGQLDVEVSEVLEPFFGGDNAFMHSYMSYDPMDYIYLQKEKILFIYGTMDSQVSSTEVDQLGSSYRAVIIPQMNHVLKKVINEQQNTQSYSQAIYPVHDELVDVLLDFILR